MLRILIGWDGLGVRSYLLVIYYNSSKSYNSGMLTFMRNRVGDALIIGALAFFVLYPSINLSILRNLSFLNPLLFFSVIIASFTKRAQVPFSAWLPAAIAAPTPVSSLVHSSTLVTAGVYLIFRLKGVISKIHIDNLIIIFGTMTIIIARMAAFFETDMKKIVALSTLRQLGVIVTAIGAGLKILAFFHLIAHAFFKALLFVRTGNLIHSSESYQDIRFVGGSSSETMPLTRSVSLTASLSLCGLPFISAFYSKEIVIEIILINTVSLYSYTLIMLGIIMTLFYSIRFLIHAIRLYERQQPVFSKHDSDMTTNSRIVFLLLPAIAGGSILNDSQGPNIIIILDIKLKFFTLLLITLSMLFFKIYMSKIYYSGSVLSLWLSGSMWILPLFTSRLPIKLSINLGEYFIKIRDFAWLSYWFLIFTTSFNRFSSISGFSFQKVIFIRLIFYSSTILILFFLL